LVPAEFRNLKLTMSGQGCSVTHKRDQEGPPLASYKKSHNPFDALSDDEDEDDDEPIISVTDGTRDIPSDTNGRREKGTLTPKHAPWQYEVEHKGPQDHAIPEDVC
jgi:hypothetical protein